jgi:mono/diheme cytochrome c family protein
MPTVAVGNLPSYSAPSGSAAHGAQVFATYCAGCHGGDGTGGKAAGSVVDSAYLNLVTDQYLRTIIIAGRPELGHPNWHNAVEGKPMSDQDIADVVAWLISHREAGKGALPAEMRR